MGLPKPVLPDFAIRVANPVDQVPVAGGSAQNIPDFQVLLILAADGSMRQGNASNQTNTRNIRKTSFDIPAWICEFE